MWTETTQLQYRRDGLRYASDVTDQEWAQIEALLPPPKRLGRPRTTALRAVVNALLYLLTTGCQWRLLPKEFPPFSTVQRFFYLAGRRVVADDQSLSGHAGARGGRPRG